MGFFKELEKISRAAFGVPSSGDLKSAEKKLTGRPDLPQWDYQSPSPYSGNVQWDETGRPVGQMPRGNFALDYQYEADRRTQQRRDVLWSDARQALQRGAGVMESYRPGGAAALSSGIYGQMAGLSAQQAMSLESPDLLMGYREHKQDMADYERKKAEGKARLLSIASAGATLLGGGMGGGAQPTAPVGQQMYPQAIGPQPVQGQGSPVGGLAPGQQGPPVPNNIPGQPFQARTGGGPQHALQATAGGVVGQGAGLGDAMGAGMPGAPGGRSGGSGGPGAPGAGPAQQGAPGGGVGAGGMPPMSLFSSGEAAGLSMASMPIPDEVYERAAEDDDRDEFTYAMQMSATDRLASAMRSGGLVGRMSRAV